jgi:hypothetical protein
MAPDTRAFLDGVRDAEDPAPEDQERVLAAVRASVAAGALAGVSLGASKLGKLLALGGLPALKTGAAVLCLVAAGMADSSRSDVVRASRVRAPLAPASGASRPAVVASAPAGSAAVAPFERRATPRPAATPARSGASRALPPPEPGESPESLRDELALLFDVQQALKRGDGAAALRRLDEHHTSDRQLVAERQAARVFALCAAGRIDEARSAAAEFLSRHAASPQRATVERACLRAESRNER